VSIFVKLLKIDEKMTRPLCFFVKLLKIYGNKVRNMLKIIAGSFTEPEPYLEAAPAPNLKLNMDRL
jgi:hypothetical protein